MSEKKTLTVKLVRSPIGTRADHRATVRGLGLRRMNSTSTLEDTPAVRGMIDKVPTWSWWSDHQELGKIMELNTIKPSEGAKHAKRRVGRGIGSGLGKTAGRGHKGQKSRAGGYHKVGFEGGQMPLQRRLPKRGFKSALLKYNAEITLGELQAVEAAEVDLLTLKQLGLVPQRAKNVKVIKSGELSEKVVLKGIGATAGAKAAIEAAGGALA